MKLTMGGELYDTEAATRVGSSVGDHALHGADDRQEDLYKTSRGEWFIHEYGDPSTNWWFPTDEEAIRPISPDEARKWLEKRGLIDALSQHFIRTRWKQFRPYERLVIASFALLVVGFCLQSLLHLV